MAKARLIREFLQRHRQALSRFALVMVACVVVVGLSLPVGSKTPSSSQADAGPSLPTDNVLLAQEPNTQQNSTLYFNTPNFVVSVFPRSTNNSGLKMNVYNKTSGQQEQLNQPVSYRGSVNNDGWISYDSLGSRNGENVTYRASANPSTGQAVLQVISAANNAIRLQENSTSVTAMNVPTPTTPGGGSNTEFANTIVQFETRTFSTRVFKENNVRKMNVYNKLTSGTDVNGQPATLVSPAQPPYENWVSYFGGSNYNGIAARYYVRVNSQGEGLFQIVNANNNAVLIEERREGPLLVNIPPEDIPPGVTPPSAGANLDPYVAAVFGDEGTLERIKQEVPEANDPHFESSRLGRFINAGSSTNRNQTAALVNLLRARGFNARLVYRNFSYR